MNNINLIYPFVLNKTIQKLEPIVPVVRNFEIEEDSRVSIKLSGVDPSGENLQFTVTQAPQYGKYINDTYIPNKNYFGEDSLKYIAINESNLTSTEGIINIKILEINDIPVSKDIFIDMYEDTTIQIELIGNDVDTNDLTYEIVTNPLYGTFELNSNIVTYTPQSNYFGSDIIQYVVKDDHNASNISNLFINIISVNDIPISYNQSITLNEDESTTFVLKSIDDDNDTLTYEINSLPNNGTITLDGNEVTYIPNLNFYGIDSFSYVCKDQDEISNQASVFLNINSINDNPVSQNINVELLEDTSTNITLIGNDIEDLDVQFKITELPKFGTVNVEINEIISNSISYTPFNNVNSGPNLDLIDTFKYKSVDKLHAVSSENTVSIKIIPVDETQNLKLTLENQNDTLIPLINGKSLNFDLDGVSSINYYWEKSRFIEFAHFIDIGEENTYSISTSDAGYYIRCKIDYTDNDGFRYDLSESIYIPEIQILDIDVTSFGQVENAILHVFILEFDGNQINKKLIGISDATSSNGNVIFKTTEIIENELLFIETTQGHDITFNKNINPISGISFNEQFIFLDTTTSIVDTYLLNTFENFLLELNSMPIHSLYTKYNLIYTPENLTYIQNKQSTDPLKINDVLDFNLNKQHIYNQISNLMNYENFEINESHLSVQNMHYIAFNCILNLTHLYLKSRNLNFDLSHISVSTTYLDFVDYNLNTYEYLNNMYRKDLVYIYNEIIKMANDISFDNLENFGKNVLHFVDVYIL